MSSDRDISREPADEAEFLAAEARTARAALSSLRGEIWRNVIRSANVSAWAVRYPIPTLAVAAVTGVGAGVAVLSIATPSKPPPAPPVESQPVEPAQQPIDTAGPARSRMSLWMESAASALFAAALGAATDALTTAVKSGIRGDSESVEG